MAVASQEHAKSGTWGRAVVKEFRATVGTWWVSEMTNANLKTVAVAFFLYLACVAPAITFGAIYAKVSRPDPNARFVRSRSLGSSHVFWPCY